MTTFTEPQRPFEFVLSEAPGTLSREKLTIVSGAGVLPAGMVLGKITASGKYQPYDNDSVDGSEVAAAILGEGVDATSADVVAACIVRLAEVKTDALQWAATVQAAEKIAAYADLAAAYLIARS